MFLSYIIIVSFYGVIWRHCFCVVYFQSSKTSPYRLAKCAAIIGELNPFVPEGSTFAFTLPILYKHSSQETSKADIRRWCAKTFWGHLR